MEETDTDTIGLIVVIAAILAVIVAGKRQARRGGATRYCFFGRDASLALSACQAS